MSHYKVVWENDDGTCQSLGMSEKTKCIVYPVGEWVDAPKTTNENYECIFTFLMVQHAVDFMATTYIKRHKDVSENARLAIYECQVENVICSGHRMKLISNINTGEWWDIWSDHIYYREDEVDRWNENTFPTPHGTMVAEKIRLTRRVRYKDDE